jgi:hypothetical protein
MPRALGLAVAFVLLVVPAAEAFREPSGKLLAGSEETVLRLHDLPPGYQVGDDSGCGPLGPPGGEEGGDLNRAERRYGRWVVRYWPEGCFYEYEQIFAVPELGPAPPEVEAETLNTPSEAAALSGYKIYLALFDGSNTGRNRKAVKIPPTGTAALLIHSHGGAPGGKQGPARTYVFWRFGKLLSFIQTEGLGPRQNDQAALKLAAAQQSRLEHPSPYTEAERDDTEVWLDDPELPVPVYWLGRDFAPGGPLPAAEFIDGFGLDGNGPPGEKLRINYNGFALDTFTAQSWKRFQGSELGRLNRKARCTKTSEVDLAQGDAVVYAGYVKRRRGGCPARAPDRHWAIVRIDDLVIGVNLTICTKCAGRDRGAYNSVRGMKAIVRGLQLRPEPVFGG